MESPLVRKNFESLGFPTGLSFFLPPKLHTKRLANQEGLEAMRPRTILQLVLHPGSGILQQSLCSNDSIIAHPAA